MSRPILIVGSGRSGTSILTWCLGQHPNILAVPETDWITAMASWADGLHRIGMVQHPSGHLSWWDVSRERFLEHLGRAIDAMVLATFEAKFPNRHASLEGAIVQEGLAWFRSLDDPKKRWVNGTPSCTGYTAILAAMFPGAQFINLVRDPVRVVQSLMGASFRQESITAANALVENVYHSQRAGYLAHAAFGERTIRVVYEDFIENSGRELRRIIDFAGEDYSPDCLLPLAEKINSSGKATQAVMDEYASVENTEMMREMRRWYAAASDPEWRIMETADVAREQLAAYARYKIPMTD